MSLSFLLGNTWYLPILSVIFFLLWIITYLPSLGFSSGGFLICVSFKWLHFYTYIKVNLESRARKLKLAVRWR